MTAARARLDALWAEGHAMTLEQAVAYVLEGSDGDAEKPAQAVATSKESV